MISASDIGIVPSIMTSLELIFVQIANLVYADRLANANAGFVKSRFAEDARQFDPKSTTLLKVYMLRYVCITDSRSV